MAIPTLQVVFRGIHYKSCKKIEDHRKYKSLHSYRHFRNSERVHTIHGKN